MRYTGIMRRIDDLGRIVIPKEIRRQNNIYEGDAFEIIIVDDMICFKKYNPCTHLADRAVDLKIDLSEVAQYDYTSADSKSALNQASKLMNQVYELIRQVEKGERTNL